MVVDGKEMVFAIGDRHYHCALDVTMSFIGGKWKSVVLWYLRKQPKRYSELQRHIPGITEKMLSLQLKELERDGIISKKIYPEVPPRVEYSLTDFGKTLLPMLEEMGKWGRQLGETKGTMIAKPGMHTTI